MPDATDREQIAEIVASQAPRRFALVVTADGDSADGDVTVLGWGMEFIDGTAHMVSVDGRNQYFMAQAGNALMYIRMGSDADIVWLDEARRP